MAPGYPVWAICSTRPCPSRRPVANGACCPKTSRRFPQSGPDLRLAQGGSAGGDHRQSGRGRASSRGRPHRQPERENPGTCRGWRIGRRSADQSAQTPYHHRHRPIARRTQRPRRGHSGPRRRAGHTGRCRCAPSQAAPYLGRRRVCRPQAAEGAETMLGLTARRVNRSDLHWRMMACPGRSPTILALPFMVRSAGLT